MTSAVDEQLYEVTLTKSEVDMLQRLMGASSDDPRLHGTIGTCFWFHGILEEDDRHFKDTWTTLQAKMEDL
jgi:hypothetical protein